MAQPGGRAVKPPCAGRAGTQGPRMETDPCPSPVKCRVSRPGAQPSRGTTQEEVNTPPSGQTGLSMGNSCSRQGAGGVLPTQSTRLGAQKGQPDPGSPDGVVARQCISGAVRSAKGSGLWTSMCHWAQPQPTACLRGAHKCSLVPKWPSYCMEGGHRRLSGRVGWLPHSSHMSRGRAAGYPFSLAAVLARAVQEGIQGGPEVFTDLFLYREGSSCKQPCKQSGSLIQERNMARPSQI